VAVKGAEGIEQEPGRRFANLAKLVEAEHKPFRRRTRIVPGDGRRDRGPETKDGPQGGVIRGRVALSERCRHRRERKRPNSVRETVFHRPGLLE
jgi:hypothetical protein